MSRKFTLTLLLGIFLISASPALFAQNKPPLASNDRYITVDAIITGNVLQNDTDSENNNLIASLVTAPVHGTVVLYADGSFTYTSNTGYLGMDSLIYQVCDNGTPSLCDTATVLFEMVNNLPPHINAPGNQSVPANTNLIITNSISISDANAGTTPLKMKLAVFNGTLTLQVKTGLTFTSGTGTAEPTFEFTGLLADLNNALKYVIYTPTVNFNDTDTLKFYVNDQYPGNPLQDSNKVMILVVLQEPIATKVTSQSSDGRYALGDGITIQVVFNKPVEVTGTPRLLLETGTTDQYATYLNRNGTTVNFRYEVQNGDESSDLDYVSTGALELNGGTIRNTANTLNAILTLPAPASASSLAGSKSILVDGVRPTITSAIWPANGIYKEGETLNFSLQISERIINVPTTLPVTIGAITIQAALKNILPSELTYSYTIKGGEIDADGITVASPTGNITDEFGNPLEPMLLTPLPGVRIDAVVPIVTAAQVFSIAEGKPAGTVAGTIAATDAGAVLPLQNWQLSAPSTTFQLNPATGELSLLRTLNRATEPFFDISVTVTDGVNTSTAVTVRVNVTDATPPSIVSMDYPADGLYKEGDELTFTAHLSEGIMITTSTLPVTIGTTTVQAALKSNTATQLTYAYIIQNGSLDADGIVVNAPTGTITDSSGNALQAFTPVQRRALLVDAVPPIVTANQVFTIAENTVIGTVIGTIAATDAGAVKPLQNWQLTSTVFKLDNTTGALSLLSALNYEANTSFDISVTVTDGINTSTAQTVRINIQDVNEAPTMDAIANVTPCAGGTVNQFTVAGVTAGPETAQTVTLSISADRDIFSTLTIDNSGLVKYALKADATGTATVTVTAKDNGGTANNGTDTYSRNFTASVGTGSTISITSNKGNMISKGDIAQLTATGATSYTWDNAEGIVSGQNTAILAVRPFQKITYHVKGTAANGCISEGSFELDIKEDFKLDATNIITPNGDGINDRWVIRNIDAYPNNEVKVFDRAGRLIYQKKGYLNEWGGTANVKPLQDGTYYFILDFGPELPKFKGYITVIRDIH